MIFNCIHFMLKNYDTFGILYNIIFWSIYIYSVLPKPKEGDWIFL